MNVIDIKDNCTKTPEISFKMGHVNYWRIVFMLIHSFSNEKELYCIRIGMNNDKNNFEKIN